MERTPLRLSLPSSRPRKKKLEQHLKNVREFKPDPTFTSYNHGSNVVIIGFFGNTGVGKSSLINSLQSLVRRSRYIRAQVGCPESQSGCSRFRHKFELTDYIHLVDNRGLDRMGSELVLEEIKDQIDGKRGYATEVSLTRRGSHVAGDPIHVAVVVVSCRQTYGVEEHIDGQRFILQFKRCLGRSPLAVVTHQDVAKKEKLVSVYEYLTSIGVDRADIFVVANETTEKPELRDIHKLELFKLLERSTLEAAAAAEFRARRVFEEEDGVFEEGAKETGSLDEDICTGNEVTADQMNDKRLTFHREYNMKS